MKNNLSRSKEKEWIISEISITPRVIGDSDANPPVLGVTAIQTTGATFQINNAKLYVPVVALPINDTINFLENIKQGFKRTIPWNKYRSEMTAQPKNNNLDYLIDPTFRNINILFVLLFKHDNDDPKRDSLDANDMPLAKIKDFNALIDHNLFFDQPLKNKKHMENLSKCQQTMIIQQEIY